MSRENVKKFMELVKAEESLTKRMVALKDGLQEGEFAFKDDKEFVEKKILPLAKEYGIEFSVEDFMEFTSSQLTSLSEEELAEVSGGFIGECFAALAIALGSSTAVAAVKNVVSFFTGSGTSTSTMQSVTDKDVDMSSAAGAEEKSNKIEFDERFKAIKKEFSKKIKTAFEGINSYMSPEVRSTWMDTVANQEKQINSREDKYVNSRYNKANDRVEFTATWTDKLNGFIDTTKCSQAVLNGKLGNLLKQQYQEAYGSGAAQLTQQYNELSQQLQQKQNSLGQYASIDQYEESINIGKQTITNLISQLQSSVNGTLDTNTDFNALKESFMSQGGQWHYGTYYYTYATQINLIDQIIERQKRIATDQESIRKRNELTEEINKINLKMQETTEMWQPYANKQAAFNDNMKTEFVYFYGELVKALKEDKNISKIANSANTTEAKTALANKIKEKAEQLVHNEFSKQILDGCSLVVEQQGDSVGMKIVYEGKLFNQDSFSVDEFISTENHLEIINSEASKKRDEVAKKLAEYMQRQYTKITVDDDLKRTIQSVLTDLKDGKLNELNLGMQIVNSDANQVTFSSVSGGQQRNTLLTIGRIADEYNKMVNMQALETTRQQNEGTISYTPFGRKLWNSIGSQAQHVFNTIAQIEAATGNLSDVKESGAFENDLKYVAGRILTQGNSPYGLKGDHHTDTSLKAEDLQKIQEFAAKIKK